MQIGCKPKQYLYEENQVLVMKDSSQYKIRAKVDVAVRDDFKEQYLFKSV